MEEQHFIISNSTSPYGSRWVTQEVLERLKSEGKVNTIQSKFSGVDIHFFKYNQ